MHVIPKKIFQTWKEKTISNNVLLKWQKSWINFNPTFEYTLWDDNDNRNFVQTKFPELLEHFDAYTKTICRADAIRYMYLYEYGGIYADLDFECIKSFDSFITQMETEQVDVVLGTLGPMDNPIFEYHRIPNAIMISAVHADFWKFVLNALGQMTKFDLYPELQTGPVFLKCCVMTYINKSYDRNLIIELYGTDIFQNALSGISFSSKIYIAEPELFYPINWGNKEHSKYRQNMYTTEELQKLFPTSLAVTFWMHSW